MMQWDAVLIGAILIIVGLFGIIVPVLPGLLLVWAGTVVWAILADGWTPWIFAGTATAVYAGGLVTEFLIPGKYMKTAGVRWSTQAVGLVGAIVCAFLIPVVGFFLGFPLAVFLLELAKTRNVATAWRLTVSALKGMGMNVLVELATGFLIAAVFAIGVFTTW